MSNQYFENNPNLKSEIHEMTYYLKGKEIKFFSDNGVFSKGGIDFGSSLLIKNVKIKENDKVLDVGCGYGTIGVSLALLNPSSSFELVDVNLRAIDLTKLAIEKNKVENAACFESNIYENVKGKFDVIVTNPPIRAGKQIVHKILLDGRFFLNDGGKIISVIQKKQGAKSAIKAMEEVYSSVKIIAEDKGYCIIESIK